MFDHDFPFDPTYGYDQDAMLQIEPPPAPEGFEAFWRDTYNQALAVKPNIELKPSPYSTDAMEVQEVYFDAWGGVRLGGWFAKPRHATAVRNTVFSHGYGGRAEPGELNFDPPGNLLFYCARGFHLSAYDAVPPNQSSTHVVHGLEHRDTYMHRGCAADIWAAATVLNELCPDTADRLQFRGGSYGGGMGALALPWDDRFSAAAIEVPSFGHHPIRLDCPCTGSGEAVRKFVAAHPEARDILPYYDSATAATYLTIPTHVNCALFDPAVPPPGQFAVHNAIAGPKKLHTVPAGHFEYPTKPQHDRAVWQSTNDWLNSYL